MMEVHSDLLPDLNQVVETKEVAIFVVPFFPVLQVRDGSAIRKRCGLPKVNQVDACHRRAVVNKQQ